MKNIKTFEQFVNENQVNEKLYTYKDVKKEYLKNPYGLGANTAEVFDEDDDTLIFRFEDSRKRDEAINKLKKAGYPSNKLGKSKQDRAYQYRYELIVSESIIPENINESIKSKDVKKIMDMFEEFDGDEAEELIMALSKWYSDAEEDLTNMNARKISDHLFRAAEEIRKRTGN